MKTNLVSSLLLIVTLSATAMPAAANATNAYAFPVKHIDHQNAQIRLGATEMKVRQALGAPNRRLSPDVCVYFNFRAEQKVPDGHGCNAMIVTFANGKVVDLKLANPRAIKLMAENLTTKAAAQTRQVAATK